jgi:hypothetical protein
LLVDVSATGISCTATPLSIHPSANSCRMLHALYRADRVRGAELFVFKRT